jgi:RND superfamily putative drug exporter
VTCAALILVVSFLSLSSNPNQLVKIVASALAFGVIVDAVIVRTLLVPALVTLMGRWNWWMPPIAARVLRLPLLVRRPGHEQHSTVTVVPNSQPSSPPMEGDPNEERHAERRS